jgi:hypothetical protein
MGSRDKDGERFRSNRLKKDKGVDDTAAPAEDIGLQVYHFDGVTTDNLGTTFPKYRHPGGVQVIDDILVVPMECGCDCDWGLYNCDKEWCDEPGLTLFDVGIDPQHPTLLLHEEFDFDHGLGVVGVAKVLASDFPDDPENEKIGKYLFVLTWGDSAKVKFAWSDTDDLRSTTAITLEEFEWHESSLGSDSGTWREWQTLNFVREKNGALYVIGADNTTAYLQGGDDYIGLFKVHIDKLSADGIDDAIEYVNQRHLHLADHWKTNVANLGDLDAASGAYVSPTGQLMVYTADHKGYKKEGNHIIEMGEFRNIEVSHTGTCGLHFPMDLGGPYDVNEGEILTLYIGLYYIEPWVHMFAETNFSNRTLMLDWVDQENDIEDHWRDFKKLSGWPFYPCGVVVYKTGFNDTLKSFKFCGPSGSTLELFDDDGFKVGNTSYPAVAGTGIVISDSDTANEDFECEATSARINWTRPAALSIDVDWGEGAVESYSTSTNTTALVATHRYLDDNPTGTPSDEYTITIMDADGGINEVSATVTVHNVAPVVGIDAIIDETTGLEIGPGSSLPFALTWVEVGVAGSFTDAGVEDTHTATLDWGDGTVDNLGAVFGSAHATHVYVAAGDYAAILTVADDDSGQGLATAQIPVVGSRGAIRIIIDGLKPHAADPDVRAAIRKLAGALHLWGKSSPNALLQKIKQAMEYLEQVDPSLDLTSTKSLLALAAKSMANEAIARTESIATKPNEQRKIEQAKELIEEGDALLASSDYVEAVDRYQQAVRRLQSIWMKNFRGK